MTRSGGASTPAWAAGAAGAGTDGLLGRVFFLSSRVGGIVEGIGVQEVQAAAVQPAGQRGRVL